MRDGIDNSKPALLHNILILKAEAAQHTRKELWAAHLGCGWWSMDSNLLTIMNWGPPPDPDPPYPMPTPSQTRPPGCVSTSRATSLRQESWNVLAQMFHILGRRNPWFCKTEPVWFPWPWVPYTWAWVIIRGFDLKPPPGLVSRTAKSQLLPPQPFP